MKQHTATYTKTMNITTDDLVNALSCANDISYWGEICFDEAPYEAARKRLVAKEEEAKASNPLHEQKIVCFEEVLVEMLEHGDNIKIWDREGNEEFELCLERLLTGIVMNAAERGESFPDEWDGTSGDCIIQYAIFNELVYG